ncbi:MAG: hypothetical protein HQK55_11660 [Deltaproteobacteria bacterium]|nr:hypothetical protein [Deltaproteobacteria bacterium]
MSNPRPFKRKDLLDSFMKKGPRKDAPDPSAELEGLEHSMHLASQLMDKVLSPPRVSEERADAVSDLAGDSPDNITLNQLVEQTNTHPAEQPHDQPSIHPAEQPYTKPAAQLSEHPADRLAARPAAQPPTQPPDQNFILNIQLNNPEWPEFFVTDNQLKVLFFLYVQKRKFTNKNVISRATGVPLGTVKDAVIALKKKGFISQTKQSKQAAFTGFVYNLNMPLCKRVFPKKKVTTPGPEAAKVVTQVETSPESAGPNERATRNE